LPRGGGRAEKNPLEIETEKKFPVNPLQVVTLPLTVTLFAVIIFAMIHEADVDTA
jgi:hypothetical protein